MKLNTLPLWRSLIAAAALLVSAHYATAQERSGVDPTTFISDWEIDEIKERLTGGDPATQAAYNRLISAANGYLNQSPFSVTDDGNGKTFNGNANNRRDYSRAISMAKAVYNLSMAWRMSGEDKYGEKALQLINHWCIDPTEGMSPDVSKVDVVGRLLIFITHPSFIYGADMIWGYEGWTDEQRVDFIDWVRVLGETTRVTPTDGWTYPANDRAFPYAEFFNSKGEGLGSLNNKESWRHVLIATAGGFLEDAGLQYYAFKRFRELLPLQIGAPGMEKEFILLIEWDRASPKGGLFYSNYALNAMVQLAELAWQQGVDLYHYENQGISLKKALDHHVSFDLDPSTWTLSSTDGIEPKAGTFGYYQIAYKRLGLPQYKQVADKYGPELVLYYSIFGDVGLTHARDDNDVNTPINQTNFGHTLGWVYQGNWPWVWSWYFVDSLYIADGSTFQSMWAYRATPSDWIWTDNTGTGWFWSNNAYDWMKL